MWKIEQNSAGIGLRSEHIPQLIQQEKRADLDFLELAPDNWMNIGGAKREYLAEIAQKYPLIAHSLSLSIGDPCPLNERYIKNIRTFLDDYHIDIYSDHLCFSRDKQGYLYDLLPVPRFAESLPYLVERIDRVQNLLGRRLVLENISSYYGYAGEMPEVDFWLELLERSGCGMLLDINNVYVNAINHGFNAQDYIRALPSESVVYYHIAGHLKEQDIILDTHGTPVVQEVIDIAQETFKIHGPRPLLLERDNHVPPLDQLCNELSWVRNSII